LSEACEREIMLRAADLVQQWEFADPRDRWRHTGEAPPKPKTGSDKEPVFYRTPESTVAAFWYVVGECKPERLKAWLANHPQDRPYLLKLLEGK
jgi:hypothetical protein